MAARYMPTVQIRGVDISPTPADLVVLDGVEITWGRDGLFDPNEPATAVVDILDATGDYVSEPALYQSPITIRTSVGILFRGFVDGIEISSLTTTNALGDTVQQWRARLTASDILALLARTVPAGIHPASPVKPPTERALGADYWGQAATNGNQRVLDIRTRIAEISDVTLNAGTPTLAPGRTVLAVPDYAATDDLYLMVQRMYATRELKPVAAAYRPDAHTIYPQYFAPSATMILAYVASQIVVQSASGGRAVDAGTVILDDNAAITSTISNNVSSIGGADYLDPLNYEVWRTAAGTDAYYVSSYEATDVLVQIPGLSSNSGRTTYDTKATFYRRTDAAGSPNIYNRMSDLATAITPYVQAVNGKFYAPPITFDLERWNYGPAVEADLLAGYGLETPIAFPGALFETLTGWGPYFQMIGAVMTYRDGWQITGKFAPAAGGIGSLAINQLVTSPTPTFDQYVDYITLATLGTVSGGI